MKHTGWFVSGLLSVLMVLACGAKAEPPFSPGSFKQVCAAARKAHRIVLIDFYTTWCGPCKLLDRNTWTDPHVRAWLGKTAVCTRIDAEKETALAARYKINAYPTILLLKPDGREIDRLVGYRGPEDFLKEAHEALSGHDSVARAQAVVDTTGKNDPSARMNHAMALEQKGQYAEALKEYLWCLDEGVKYQPAFIGVRLSFLLSDIRQLGAQYPQAIDALKQRRDAAHAALEQGSSDRQVAVDFAAYNQNLDEQQQTLAVYDALKAKDSAVAGALFDNVWGLLLQQRRYAELVANAGDIPGRVDREIEMYRYTLQAARSHPELLEYMKAHTLEQSCGYYEALVGADRVAEARAIRDKLLKFDGGAATYVALVHHAVRADRPATVQELVAQAKGALSPADLKKVVDAAGSH